MIKIKLIILSIIVLLFTSCGKQNPKPFNQNNTGLVFIQGKPYKIPYGVLYQKTTVTNKEAFLFQDQQIRNCTTNHILWYKKFNSKAVKIPSMILSTIMNKNGENMTITEAIKETKLNTINKQVKRQVIIIFNKLSLMTSDNTTFKQLKNNRQVVGYLSDSNEIANFIYQMKKGLAGCILPISDKEYNYYVWNERQQAKFKHESNIQSQKSLDKSLDRLNDTVNSMTPKTHNINHSGSINLYNY